MEKQLWPNSRVKQIKSIYLGMHNIWFLCCGFISLASWYYSSEPGHIPALSPQRFAALMQ